MPELPEVQTVVSTLEHQLGEITFKKARVLWDNIIAYPSVKEFEKQIENQTIHEYLRYGKFLVFKLDDYFLIAHLRMEGKFYVQDSKEDITKHMHVIFDLDNGKQLRYHDTRKFGKMYLYPLVDNFKTLPPFKNIGLDAFDDALTVDYLKSKLKRKDPMLKVFLLDQNNIAGIGNIYADEICFSLDLDPRTPMSKLSDEKLQQLIDNTRMILREAIKAGGTTIRSYTSSLGVDGRFQLQLKVHQKEGELCPNCQNEIKKIKVGGRGTYICDKCQKKL